jgi:small nuclear ribonucleoprotein (snRNP)-like protein
MWKLTRNMVLLTLALGAALQLLLWVAAQQQASAIVAQLAPWVDVKYSGAGSGFDGTLRLSQVEIVPKRGAWRDPLYAESMRLSAGGPLWLLSRAVSRSDALPEQMHLQATAVRWPKALLTGNSAWLNPKNGVPFDTFGCGTGLSDTDYGAMQRKLQLPNLVFDFSREEAEHEMQFDLRVIQPSFATMQFRLELKPFDFAMLDDAKALMGTRVANASLNYHDEGYFAARNRFCAQRLGSSIDEYLGHHLAAVTAFLAEHEVEPAKESLGLYRSLLAQGGEMELLSLPNPAVSPAGYSSHDRSEVLRFLNLTARHDQAPPILFKLNFLAPSAVEPDTGVVVATPSAPVPTSTTPQPATPAAPSPTLSPIATPKPEVAQAIPAKLPAPVPAPPSRSDLPVVSAPPSMPLVATSKPAPAVAPSSSMPAAVPAAPGEKLLDPTTGKPLASIDAPTGGESTLALVWKGATLEKLPPTAPTQLPYSVVGLEGLAGYVGRRLTVVTEGGKEIEGTLSSVDQENVVIRVRRQTGSAELSVARGRVREVHIPRPISHD